MRVLVLVLLLCGSGALAQTAVPAPACSSENSSQRDTCNLDYLAQGMYDLRQREDTFNQFWTGAGQYASVFLLFAVGFALGRSI